MEIRFLDNNHDTLLSKNEMEVPEKSSKLKHSLRICRTEMIHRDFSTIDPDLAIILHDKIDCKLNAIMK